MRAEELLMDLDPTQRAAVTEPVVPLAILAPAGSGKTRALTRRIAWQAADGNLDPNHVLAVTFTRKAAGELRGRLSRLGVRGAVTAGTFHAVALAQLRRRHADAGTAMPALLDRKARLLGPLLGGARGAELAVAINEIASEIEWAKARRIRPDGYAAQVQRAERATPRAPGEIATIYTAYEREKRKKGLLDFDDLIAACTEALETDPGFAATQRWRFRHLFVDEFQDVTRAQLGLLRAWLGDGTDLCVVGDPDQAIYAFAGADAGLLTRFGDWFEGATVVRLGANYRSTPEIVTAARAVLPELERAEVRAAGCRRTASDDHRVPHRCRGGPGGGRGALPGARSDATVVDHGGALPGERAVGAVRRGARPRRGPLPGARRGGVPRPARGEGGDRRAAQEREDRAGSRVRRAPHGPRHRRERAVRGPARARRRGRALGREYLAAEGSTGSVKGFLEYLRASLRGGDDGGLHDDAVDLLTFHRAKGLEWDTVFVTGLERGLVPISHATGKPDAIDEERRPPVRRAQSRGAPPAPLLGEGARAGNASLATDEEPVPHRDRAGHRRLPPTEVETAVDRQRGPAGARQRLAALEAGEIATSDRPLYDALVTWRRELARAAAVPAYVILDNKTLRNVASARPRSSEALLALPGIGPVKLERYGAALLEVVGHHSG